MRFIKYIGPSHVRQITAQDWRSVGINAETVTWSQWNGFSVPADSLTDDQILRAIDPDQYFVITDDQESAPKTLGNDRMTGEMALQPTVDVVDMLNDGENVSTASSDGPEKVSDPTPASTTGGKAKASS